MPFNLPEKYKMVTLFGGASNGSITTASDYICLKNAHRVYIVGYYFGTAATTFPVSLLEATTVAGGSAQAVVPTFPIWKVIATTSTDALARQTDAASLTIDPDGTDSTMLFVFEWDPSKHTAGFDCLAVKGGTGSASDTVVVLAFLEERYPQAAPPSAIID